MTYRIQGWAAVFDADGHEVSEPAIFRRLSGYVVNEYATDYLGGTEVQDLLAEALERSGQLHFEYREGEAMMRVISEFSAKRSLTTEEVRELVSDTLGQWSDGMGECVFIEAGDLKDYKLQPLSEEEVTEPEYPYVRIESGRDA